MIHFDVDRDVTIPNHDFIILIYFRGVSDVPEVFVKYSEMFVRGYSCIIPVSDVKDV